MHEESGALPPKCDFSAWYNDILWLAEIMDVRYPVKGLYVWYPHGFAIRKRTYAILRELLDRDHEETLFPLLILGQHPLRPQLVDYGWQVVLVHLMIIAVYDLVNSLGESLENIHILRVAESPDFQGLVEEFQLLFQSPTGNAVKSQRPDEEAHYFVDTEESGSGDEPQIHPSNNLFEQDIG